MVHHPIHPHAGAAATDLKAPPSRRVVVGLVAVLSPAFGKGVRWTLSRER